MNDSSSMTTIRTCPHSTLCALVTEVVCKLDAFTIVHPPNADAAEPLYVV